MFAKLPQQRVMKRPLLRLALAVQVLEQFIWAYQSAFERVDDDLSAVPQCQLFENISAMGWDSCLTDTHVLRDSV
jgi:hypothetical protein